MRLYYAVTPKQNETQKKRFTQLADFAEITEPIFEIETLELSSQRSNEEYHN